MQDDPAILIQAIDSTQRRGGGPVEIQADVLRENLNIFIRQLDIFLDPPPSPNKSFACNEITLSATISTSGKFVLLGSGIESGIQGAITFKFSKET